MIDSAEPKTPFRRMIMESCEGRKIANTKHIPRPTEKNLPLDPSSWATGRVGNLAVRWLMIVANCLLSLAHTLLDARVS